MNEYNERMTRYDLARRKLTVAINHISNWRLITVLLGLGISGFLYWKKWILFSSGSIIITATIFIYLVIVHGKLSHDKKKIDILHHINDNAIKRLNGEWTSFSDTGTDFIDEDHNYAGDLDLFGQASVFQWINIGVTPKGRQALKQILTEPQKDCSQIVRRQQALQELSKKLDWRQDIQAEALLAKKGIQDTEALFLWLEDTHEFYSRMVVRLLCRILPPLTILLLFGSFMIPALPYNIPIILIAGQIIMIGMRFIQMNSILNGIGPYANNINVYRKMLQAFELEKFESEYLNEIQKSIQNSSGKNAYALILELEKITDRISIRYSELYLIINILLLWDFQCLFALEDWKKRSGRALKEWIDVLGEIEALSSLSTIYFDHPDWAIPVLDQKLPDVFGVSLGHPLMPGTRVCNDLSVMKKGQIFIITGSNMSGKSTLLRTIGLNMVLAYAGAPVCARNFHCGIYDIFTSMRVRDDLERNISSFYAELIRIKRMIEAAQTGKSIFFLLDEVFKGTNSLDRHLGARILIKQLSDLGSMGLVSTHDIELGDLAKEEEKISNYHFREYYEDGHIRFDYKLRPGVSTTRNAVYLMKMAGITVPEA